MNQQQPNHYGPNPHTPWQPPVKQPMSVGKKIAIGAAATLGGLFMLGACGALLDTGDTTPTPSSKPAAAETTEPTPDEAACKKRIRKEIDDNDADSVANVNSSEACSGISEKRYNELVDLVGADALKDLVNDDTAEPKPEEGDQDAESYLMALEISGMDTFEGETDATLIKWGKESCQLRRDGNDDSETASILKNRHGGNVFAMSFLLGAATSAWCPDQM